MALSDRVDLTSNRDFGPQLTFTHDMLDLLAYESQQEFTSIVYDLDPVEADVRLSVRRLYPWNIFKLDSTITLPEILYSDDELSQSIGVEFWDEPSHPFLLGSTAERIFNRRIIQEELTLNCYECGKELDALDFAESASVCTCRKCANSRPFRIPWQ